MCGCPFTILQMWYKWIVLLLQVFLGTSDGTMHVLSDQGIAIMEREIVRYENIQQLRCSYDRRSNINNNNNSTSNNYNNHNRSNSQMSNPDRTMSESGAAPSSIFADEPTPTIIAVAFENGPVVFLRSHDDPDPITRNTDLYCWTFL